jgi:hypothetical protein
MKRSPQSTKSCRCPTDKPAIDHVPLPLGINTGYSIASIVAADAS